MEWNHGAVAALLFFLLFTQGEAARNTEPFKSITCYQCNSEYDPRCGDPFDPYTLGTVNCSMKRPLEHLPELKPGICRKTIQKVNGKTRVVRGCGYITDERDDKTCMRRTGTHDVFVFYCSCSKSLCNAATPQQSTYGHEMALASTVLLLASTLLARGNLA